MKLKRNYAELPQKPIKLKADIGGLASPPRKVLDEIVEHKTTRPKPIPPQMRPAKKPHTSTGQWTLRGVSVEAREAAKEAAKAQGIPLGEWLERAIDQALAPPATTQEPQREVLEALSDIQDRLEQLEQDRDWWGRLKQFLKTCVEYGRSG